MVGDLILLWRLWQERRRRRAKLRKLARRIQQAKLQGKTRRRRKSEIGPFSCPGAYE